MKAKRIIVLVLALLMLGSICLIGTGCPWPTNYRSNKDEKSDTDGSYYLFLEEEKGTDDYAKYTAKARIFNNTHHGSNPRTLTAKVTNMTMVVKEAFSHITTNPNRSKSLSAGSMWDYDLFYQSSSIQADSASVSATISLGDKSYNMSTSF